ncbi:PD-(D/E)XK nuclease family protein [Saccharicrinis aurantiacus]|uniref:PD-(D/E)XK nuclease family protein n=1 Tax=Saccharicrinis aurantiacus TaxID=1849719 RepID=UPI00248FEB41|nr:PD-(D/E)XK nuclease family protein [Saccharicrinis aurantiacus]
MNLNSLSLFFNKNNIPEIKEKPLTFLGIAKQPHYENVWSNIYAFYFNVDAEHGLKDLFIKSLLQIVNSKQEEAFQFTTNYNIHTESSTNNNGRIDLLLSNDTDAIIIENKVNHLLNNDLEDYWDSTPQANKQGILLSLKAIHHIHHNSFINITHLELLSVVMQNFGTYICEASDKFTIFLKDFYQNILNLSDPMEAQNLDFYYQHTQHINEAAKLKHSVKDYVESEVVKVCEQLNLDFHKGYGGADRGYDYYSCKRDGNLIYTVCYGGLLENSKKLDIVVELQNELLVKNRQALKDIQLKENERSILCDGFFSGTETWAHFAAISFDVSKDDFQALSSFIIKAITKSPLQSIFSKIEDFLLGDDE